MYVYAWHTLRFRREVTEVASGEQLGLWLQEVVSTGGAETLHTCWHVVCGQEGSCWILIIDTAAGFYSPQYEIILINRLDECFMWSEYFCFHRYDDIAFSHRDGRRLWLQQVQVNGAMAQLHPVTVAVEVLWLRLLTFLAHTHP